MKRWIFAGYQLLAACLTVFSYAFIDANLPFFNRFYTGFATNQRSATTIIFSLFIILLTIFYFLFLSHMKKKGLSRSFLMKLLLFMVVILIFSYPAMLSYDIFNYITTAKVAFFYGENPYLVMPIEFTSDPNLLFTRAANKIALYGPSWIVLSAAPHFLGMGNILSMLFFFKLFIASFYIAMAWVIWKISRNLFSIVLFALNPLVIIEILVSAHNDVIMMFFALLSFYLLQRKKILLALAMLLISILIKYATLFLIPIFAFALIRTWQGKKVDWTSLIHISGWSMLVILLLSPLREELYPWYVIWVVSFAVLIPKKGVLLSIALILSITALLRYTPVLFTGSYFGITPIVRELVTFVPIGTIGILWLCKKFLWQRFFQ